MLSFFKFAGVSEFYSFDALFFSPHWAYSIVNGLPMNLVNGDPCTKHFSGQLLLRPSEF